MQTRFSIHEARFIRPRLSRHVLERVRISSKVREALDYPLTLIRAGAGYGKSTLMAHSLTDQLCLVAWLNLGPQEREPEIFLSHLIFAVSQLLPEVGMRSLQPLARDGRLSSPDWRASVAIFAEEAMAFSGKHWAIVLDDYQQVADSEGVLNLTDALLRLLPDTAHIIIASREKVNIPALALKRAKNEVLEIGEQDLAFNEQEVRELFCRNYDFSVDEATARRLVEQTEGWIMGLQMFWQAMQKDGARVAPFADLPRTIGDLFDFLLQDYLAKQPEVIRVFLLHSSRLNYLKAEACDKILGIENSSEILKSLEDKGLFTYYVGEGYYRYHHLFQEYLKKNERMSRDELSRLHFRAATYFRENSFPEMAMEHLLAGNFFHEAGQLLKALYPHALGSGHQAEVVRWLSALPAAVINEIPELLLCRGDLVRMSGDFTGALTFYARAEKGFADHANLSGGYQVAKAYALVYLDSVQPVLADKYLTVALSLVEEDDLPERAQLYKLQAENNINLGRSERAEPLFRKANELFLEDSRGDVEARMHLRTGRLSTAKSILTRQEQKVSYRLPRSHRETPLLLSLINSFMGELDEAAENAYEGLRIGKRLNAGFVESIGYMRLGHAKQLQAWTDMTQAVECYQQALQICASLDVERGKGEPLWGLCLVYGHRGNLDSALRYGLEGLRVCHAAQDDWLAGMIELALAIAYFKSSQQDKAAEWLQNAKATFVRCGDSYLLTVTMFWQGRLLLEKDDNGLLRDTLDELLRNAEAHDYDFIFHKPTILGLRDAQGAKPLLLAAQKENIRSFYVGSLISELGINAEIASHPGYTLRIKSLGTFRVWRGLEEIRAKEWQREKAKRLFQYLLTYRKRLVGKEQIIEALWGEAGTDSDFKVALNALTNALEPGRNARSGSFYISKQQGTYGLNLAAGISLDVDEFESYINRAKRVLGRDSAHAAELFRLALNLYAGEYMPDCCYEDWCREEKERLHLLYITAAEKLAGLYLDQGETAECISLSLRIIDKDKCWEAAYRMLMRCYHQQNNRTMIFRVYKQCQDNFKSELGIYPASETIKLFKILTSEH